MSMSVLMPVSEEARRFEVFTGEGRRRRFSASEKAAIVAESYEAGVNDLSHFTRAFHIRYGAAPSKFRRAPS